MTKKNKITAQRLPTNIDLFSSVNIKYLEKYDPNRDVFGPSRLAIAIFMPQSMVELLVLERATGITDFVLNSDDEIADGFVGHYRGWPCITDVLGFGPKLNFLTPQLVPLLNEPRLPPLPAGVCLLPEALDRYTEINTLRMPFHTGNCVLFVTREEFLILAGEDFFASKFIPTFSGYLRECGYVGNFDGIDVVSPAVHDSVFVPQDLEPGMYLVELDDLPGGEKLQIDHDGSNVEADEQMAPEELKVPDAEPVSDEMKEFSEAATRTLNTATDYEHQLAAFYESIAKLPASDFTALPINEGLTGFEAIGFGEVYFVSARHHADFLIAANACEDFHTVTQYEDMLDGFLGTLRGRPVITDVFARENVDPLPRRADLNGFYSVKAEIPFDRDES